MCSVNISNSYTNTAELMTRFPVLNPTPVETAMEQNIQNRLLNGFENWNRGYASERRLGGHPLSYCRAGHRYRGRFRRRHYAILHFAQKSDQVKVIACWTK